MYGLHKFAAILAAALLCAAPALLWAQPAAKDYPTKPIRVIVPSPPGGPPDLIMRMIAPKLSLALGQPIVVDNRPGAGGIVGTAFVAKAAPDGYTWLVTTASHTNIPAFNPNVSYDPVRDFTPVTMIAQNFGQVLIVTPSLPANTVQELIALAKREPGKLNYGSAGIGTASHIPAEVMKSMTGTDILGVPYKGVAEVISDLISGRIDMFFVGTQLALQHVQSGRVRALAVTGPTRWKGMPDVPTMQQAGLKDFSLINWFGLWLPAGAPPEIVARLHAEMAKALAEADIRQQFDTLGLEAVGSKPDEFARFVAKDAAFTLEVARRIQAAAK
jgi:tripartite-type tricarboxylate transporter receptor subunit TctC